MNLEAQLLFFFSAIGAFNGFILGVYFLFFAKPRHISNRFLGALLLALSIRIGKSVFYYFNEDLALGYLQLGLSACFFIGPFLYFYLKSIIEPQGNIKTTWKYHMLVLVPIVVIGGYLYPFEGNVKLWRNHIIENIYHVWLIYIFLSGLLMKNVIKDFISRKDKMNSIEIWVLSVFVGNVLIWAAYYFCGFGSYILGALSFSFMMYLLVMLLVFHKKQDSILFKSQPKYADKKISEAEASQLVQQLETQMKDHKLYKNPYLKLSDVAKVLNISSNRLSQLLNDNIGKSFSSYINEYRTEEAKKLLAVENQFTLEAIGYEAGFSSKSSFYSTFKKYTALTPAMYKKNGAMVQRIISLSIKRSQRKSSVFLLTNRKFFPIYS